MARPLTADNWIAALKRWGIPFVEEPNWRTRANSRGWGEVEGFMVHHTGDDAPDSADLTIVRDGRAGLSGPLCNVGLEDSGRVRLVAAGAANHAGGGDAAVIRAMIAGKPLPAPRYSHLDLGDYPDAIIGNPRFAGVEAFYYLKNSPAQRAMMPLLVAAWIDGMNRQNGTKWSGNRLIGHKEWQRGKIDPKLFGDDSMNKMRAQCAAYLQAGPEGVDNVAITKEDAAVIWGSDIIPSPDLDKDNPTWGASSYLRFGYRQARNATTMLGQLTKQITGMQAQVTALVGAVAALSQGEQFDEAKLLASIEEATKKGILDAGAALNAVQEGATP